METLGLPSSLQSSWPSLKRLIRLKRVVFFRVLSINGLQNFIVLKGNFINSIWFINRQGKKILLYACLDGLTVTGGPLILSSVEQTLSMTKHYFAVILIAPFMNLLDRLRICVYTHIIYVCVYFSHFNSTTITEIIHLLQLKLLKLYHCFRWL